MITHVCSKHMTVYQMRPKQKINKKELKWIIPQSHTPQTFKNLKYTQQCIMQCNTIENISQHESLWTQNGWSSDHFGSHFTWNALNLVNNRFTDWQYLTVKWRETSIWTGCICCIQQIKADNFRNAYNSLHNTTGYSSYLTLQLKICSQQHFQNEQEFSGKCVIRYLCSENC